MEQTKAVVASLLSQVNPLNTQEIPIASIQISRRMRRTDEARILDLAESIKGVGLLHSISVALKEDSYYLIQGLHRVEAFRILKRETIPATVIESNQLIEDLIQCEENLVRSPLNAIQESQHIKRREELLISLGRKAVVGNNQYTEAKLTNKELARQSGYTSRTYQYKKAIADMNEEAQDLLCETPFAKNMMDMYKLSKQPEHIQMQVANLLITGKCTTFRRAWVKAHMLHKEDKWSDEVLKVKEEIGIPKSVMKFERKKDELDDICYIAKTDDSVKVNKVVAQFGTNEVRNYSTLPEHARWFVKYYSNKGDLVLDNFFGRGTNLIAAAYEGRKVVGYDLSPHNVETVRTALLEHTEIDPKHLTLHQSCGVELAEYKDEKDLFDLCLTDPPYIYGAEQYGDDPRDLCLIKDLGEYNLQMMKCLINLKRLIKPSSFSKKVFHPIILKVGSGRRGESGLVDMATEIEIISRKIGLVVHDKIINELRSAFQSYNLHRCIENKYTIKSHETNLVLVKYE